MSSSASACYTTVVASASAAAACVTALPASCEDLENYNGLVNLAVPAAACLVDLGAFGVGSALTCLTTDLKVTTLGSTVVDCLNTAFEAKCISELPKPCRDLEDVNGVGLVADIALCVVELGPFAVGAAAQCLATNGIDANSHGFTIVACLYEALSLSPEPTATTEVIEIDCPAVASPHCDVNLPRDCKGLAGNVGLGTAVDAVLCTADLGIYAVGSVAECLATDLITETTTGDSILTCLFQALDETCPSTLPPNCEGLNGKVGLTQIALQIPLCIVALGPYAAGDALVCLSTTGLDDASLGSSIVDCLEHALDIVV